MRTVLATREVGDKFELMFSLELNKKKNTTRTVVLLVIIVMHKILKNGTSRTLIKSNHFPTDISLIFRDTYSFVQHLSSSFIILFLLLDSCNKNMHASVSGVVAAPRSHRNVTV